MISFSPVWAIVLRHARLYRRDINLLLATFYWPLLDILIWGFLGTWIQQSCAPGMQNFEVASLLGILLWLIVGRGANNITFSLSEELWSNNIVNLFSLPLKLIEWMLGIIAFYALVMAMTVTFCMVLVYALYSVPLGLMISTYLMFLPPLFLCGIWLGFTCLQIVITIGKRGVELGFVTAWCLAPFSGAYYPVEVLPQWAQKVSAFLPMSYIFTGMRGYLMEQRDPTPFLIKGYMLSVLYAGSAMLFFIYYFYRSKRKGLARLAD